ncbi:MAG: FMN-binding protein [Candidatus Nitrotoga sp.]
MPKLSLPPLTFFIAFLLILLPSLAQAIEHVYQQPEEFVNEQFKTKPKIKLLLLTQEMQSEVYHILGHAPGKLRQRYWTEGARTLWILEEIGKTEPITAGFIVKNGRIEQAKVLIYREHRGMEVRFPAFLKQFTGVSLNIGNSLDRKIDGITGATLSVHAMERMARVALYFDKLSRTK